MKTIPVWATIAAAYRFAFRDFFRVLGVMWLGMALLWLPGIVWQHQMMALVSHDAAMVRQILPFLIPFYCLSIALISMQMIGIAKQALGIRKGPAWVYFSLGKPVWRLIGSLLLLMVALVIGRLITLLGSFLIGLLLGLVVKAVHYQPFSAAIGFLILIGIVALWCGYFYCLVRLTFLLLPIIADEREGFALAHAWNLGKGNFWRMFAVLLVVLLPFLILEGGLMYHLFYGVPFPHAPATAEQNAAFQAAMNANMATLMGGLYHYWYVFYPLATVLAVLLYGMAISAQCFAYRSLAPVAGDGLPD